VEEVTQGVEEMGEGVVVVEREGLATSSLSCFNL